MLREHEALLQELCDLYHNRKWSSRGRSRESLNPDKILVAIAGNHKKIEALLESSWNDCAIKRRGPRAGLRRIKGVTLMSRIRRDRKKRRMSPGEDPDEPHLEAADGELRQKISVENKKISH